MSNEEFLGLLNDVENEFFLKGGNLIRHKKTKLCPICHIAFLQTKRFLSSEFQWPSAMRTLNLDEVFALDIVRSADYKDGVYRAQLESLLLEREPILC